jgi:uracil-DNA glycosylase family 4
LRKHCLSIAKEKRKSFLDWTYWGKPIENFGDANARLLIVGLAPAAHGANRTGRMFTGDRSGDWLYRSLHKTGFANQATATHMKDGLTLLDCAITATAHCAPPDNKPEPSELQKCQPFLQRTFAVLPIKVIVALGGIAWKATISELKILGWYEGKLPKFSHGARVALKDGRVLIGSYHPSQQNTFTGRLTEPMLDSVFFDAKKIISTTTLSPISKSQS